MSTPVTDFPTPPVHGFRGDASTPPPIVRPRGLCVAISREAGARGGSIARKVGELLGWQVFGQDTLDYLVQDETARGQFLAELPDNAKSWASAHLARLIRRNRVTTDDDTRIMLELLLAAGARGDIVIVGRAAGFLLPKETTVHIRVVAPIEDRIAYFAQWLRLGREEAIAEVAARDERRAKFLASVIGRNPADPTGYDAVVNTGRLGVEGAAQFIGWAVRTKQMFAELKETDEDDGPEEFSGV